ncbi:hypothetical protein TIFTF001_053915 [Ficus carica]|uniref:Uncharacterized protein n=1 Tax=Ficus carica TaxID=3494 RepID=A0AA88EGW0_FICCA|nr:hypothetical protein TIFTF001_053915 [Ficus carica]
MKKIVNGKRKRGKERDEREGEVGGGGAWGRQARGPTGKKERRERGGDGEVLVGRRGTGGGGRPGREGGGEGVAAKGGGLGWGGVGRAGGRGADREERERGWLGMEWGPAGGVVIGVEGSPATGGRSPVTVGRSSGTEKIRVRKFILGKMYSNYGTPIIYQPFD